MSLTKSYAIETLQPYSQMTNTSRKLCHVIFTTARVSILLSKYQILSECSPNVSICFSPDSNVNTYYNVTFFWLYKCIAQSQN